jgi:hypothetical protein
MNDITDLFNRVATSADADPSLETVDGDVTRGRVALQRDHRRRTIRRSMTATSTIAAAAIVAVVIAQVGGSSHKPAVTGGKTNHHVISASHHATKPAVHKIKRIKLVAYHGKQLTGFTVDSLPNGWYLGAVSQYALSINAADDHNTDPDVFYNKLTVLLASQDEQTFPKHGNHVTVDGQPGIIWDDGGVQLGYSDGNGHRIVIQVPSALHWTNAQIVAFAQGVHVTADALAGVG